MFKGTEKMWNVLDRKRQMFRCGWSFLRPIWQGRGKSVAREENRINYEGPHLKFGFILKLIESR